MLQAMFQAMQYGKEVADPAAWKNRAIITNAITGVLFALMAIGRSFGVGIELDKTVVEGLAGGIVSLVAIFNAIIHLTTSKKVGV